MMSECFAIIGSDRVPVASGVLDLSGRRLEGFDEIAFSGPTSCMHELRLSFNIIGSMAGLEVMPHLKTLALDHNRVQCIENLEGFRGLEVLKLNDNNICKIEGLDALENLRSLNLSGNAIECIEGLDHLTKLKSLFLGKNRITGIQGLDTLEHLVSLDLSRNNISVIEGLDRLVNLRGLYLAYNPVREITGLHNLSNLTYLQLSPDSLPSHMLQFWGSENSVLVREPAKLVKFCEFTDFCNQVSKNEMSGYALACDADAWRLLAALFYNNNNLAGTIDSFLQAAEKDPDDSLKAFLAEILSWNQKKRMFMDHAGGTHGSSAT